MNKSVSKTQIFTMGMYSTVNLAIVINMMYVNTFATEVLQIPAGKLALILAFAKGIDLLVSMAVGLIIERLKLGQKGKYQGWLYYFRWVLVVACLAESFNTSAAPLVVRVAVLAVSYTLLNCVMNLIQTAYYGALSIFSGVDMNLRNQISVSFMQQATIVTLISAIVPYLVEKLPFGTWNYFFIAAVFLIPLPIALGKMAALVEGEAPAGGGGACTKIPEIIRALVRNRQLMAVFVSQLFQYIGMYVYISLYGYYFLAVLQNFSLMSLAGLISALVGIPAAILMPRIGVRMGRKAATVWGYSLFALGLFLIFLTGERGWGWYAVFMSISTIGKQLFTPFHLLMYLDCGEWYLWTTGIDSRTIANGLQSPPIKLGILIGSSLGLYLLGKIGYVSGMAADAVWNGKFMHICWLIPALFYLAAGLVLVFFYNIMDRDAAFYALENARRRYGDGDNE